MSRLRRGLAALAVSVVVTAAWASPAAAHGGDGAVGASSNFSSELVDGGAPCLSWEILANDGYLELVSRCPGTVTVLGYEGEPYLELTEDGVKENLRSPAAYLNRDANGAVVVPATADPAADPDWVIRADEPRFRWHDHRIHWMGGTEPDGLSERTLVNAWTIPVMLDETGDGGYLLETTGELWWTPPPPWWPPVVAAGVVELAVFAFFARPRARAGRHGDEAQGRSLTEEPRWPGLGGAMAALLGLAAAGAVAFAVDDAIIAARTADRVAAAVVAVFVVGLVAGAAWRGRVGDATAMFALAGGGLALTWAYGVFQRGALVSSELGGRLPDGLVRVIVAAELVVAVPMVASLVLYEWSRRSVPPVPAEEDAREVRA